MTSIQNFQSSATGRRCLLSLSAAAGTSALAAFALWASQHRGAEETSVWLLVGVVSAGAAGTITLVATKHWADWIQTHRRTRPKVLLLPAPAPVAEAPKTGEHKNTASDADASTARPIDLTAKLGSAIERERERLRNSGFSDAEISQILIARESTGNQARGSLGTGVATGVLNNIDAVVTHARSLLPSFKTDIERMLDPDAGTGARTGSAGALAVKTAALIAIGYFVYIEALQLRSMAYKSWAEACIERQKNAINFSSMNDLLSGDKLRELDKECAP